MGLARYSMIRWKLLSCNASVKIMAKDGESGPRVPFQKIVCRPFRLLLRPIQERAWLSGWPDSAWSRWSSCRTLLVNKMLDDQQKSLEEIIPVWTEHVWLSHVSIQNCLDSSRKNWAVESNPDGVHRDLPRLAGRNKGPAHESQSCPLSLNLPRANFASPGWWVRPDSREPVLLQLEPHQSGKRSI